MTEAELIQDVVKSQRELRQKLIEEHRTRISRGEELDFVYFELYKELQSKLDKAKALIDRFLDFENYAQERGCYIADDTRKQAEAFLAGLKADRPKWHKVSEQIPTEEKEYLVKLTDGTIDVMTVALDGDLEPYLLTPKFDFYKDVEKWCEIPKE